MLLYSAKRHLKLNLGIFFEQIIFWTGKHATRQSAVMTSSKKFGTELRQKSVFVSLSRSLIGCVSLISIFGFKFRLFFVTERFHFSGNSRVAPESFRQHRSAHLRPLRHEEDHPRTFSVRDGTHFRKFYIFLYFLMATLSWSAIFMLIYIKSGPGPIKKLSS